MKDIHTGGGKMARNSCKIAILLLLFVLIQTIYEIQCQKTEKLKTNTLLRYFILEDALILLYCDVRTT